jgi:hypothetical protein
MPLSRTLIVSILAVSTLLPALAVRAQEQAPPHIRRAQTFLVAWGHQKWDDLKSVAALQVTVRVGDKTFTLEPATQKSEVALVFPFHGLSTVREGEEVTGITVAELGLKVGDNETRGPATLMLKKQDGEFWVTEVATGAPAAGEKPTR